MAHVLDLDGRDVVEQLHRPIHGIDIEAVLERGGCPTSESNTFCIVLKQHCSAPAIGNIAIALRVLSEKLPGRYIPIVGGQPNIGRYCVFGHLSQPLKAAGRCCASIAIRCRVIR